MARSQHTPSLARLEEAVTVLLCLLDDAYALCSTRAPDTTNLSSNFLTRRLSPSPCSSNSSEGCRASAPPSCATPSGSSRTCSRGLGGSPPFLVQPAREEAQGLPGTSAAGNPPRAPR